MIQIYKASNTNYTFNGDYVLSPISCEIEAEINGTWLLTMEHPIDDNETYKELKVGAVISAPSFMPETQLFRIYNTIKNDDSVTVYARPIFMDSANDVFLLDCRPTGKTGQNALNEMLANQSLYSGYSDITYTSTAYYVRKNFIEALASNDDQSFLNRWGGEILYDNYTVKVMKRAGYDYGVRAEFGHNLESIEEEVNTDNVVTRIIPEAYNGYLLDGETPWIDSPLINKYPIVHNKLIQFSDVKLTEDCSEEETGFDTLAELRAELVKQCLLQFEAGIDKPECTYKVEMLELAGTEQYKDVEMLESVGLGDTVHCYNKNLDIETEARAIKIKYDCVTETNISIELGSFKSDFIKDFTSATQKIDAVVNKKGQLMAEKIQGVIDGMTTQLRLQNTVAKKTDTRAILFEDLDQNSNLYGAMSIGTQGFEIASERTPDGKEWKWSTFGTAKGFMASCLIAGILSSTNYIDGEQGFCFNLDEGTIDSKHMKLDETGLLELTQAVIRGGQFVVSYTDKWGDECPMFYVNENGVGIGEYAEGLTYFKGDSFMSLQNELRVTSGMITTYNMGYKAIEHNCNNILFYDWTDPSSENMVGAISSVKRDNENRVGIDFACDKDDYLTLGYIKSGSMIDGLKFAPIIQIDGKDGDATPWIYGGVSGSFTYIYGINWSSSNGYITSLTTKTVTVTVKNGIITNWVANN